MKSAAFALVALLVTAPASAQLGGILNKAQKAKETADKVADLNINEQEEQQLGAQVSDKIVDRFGVYQSPEVTKYVTLVGTVLAQASTRPNLPWKFIVLDTDGVNAFAAPGGFIHVTRGLLGLIKDESELAGVLGHEITHVTAKHTVRAIQKAKTVQIGADQAGSGSGRNYLISRLAEKAYTMVLENEFSRDDEGEADKVGVRLANKLGYAPAGLVSVLRKIDQRNAGREDRNGLFASHPATAERIERLDKQIKDEKLGGTATVAARYKQHVTFDAKPVTEIATAAGGAAGLAGGSGKSSDKKQEETKTAEQPKKKGGLLGRLSGSGSGDQKQSTQTVASAGARGMGKDRDATGGTNKTRVNVTLTPAEIEAFKKGITT